ncbi:prepilin peptidase [Yoonia sp.]|uniref:A24 family peptidase n=1 Tax=Yoonia sp. TaxID=2212373 RepID=UPI0035C87AA6
MTAQTALWLLPAVVPVAFYIAWNDMRSMKITNGSVLVLLGVFAVVGPFAFGLEQYLWQWLHVPVMLAIGMVLWALRTMGGGDAKMIAAMAPFFAVSDYLLIVSLFATCLIVAMIVHSLFRFTRLKNIVPEWKSWTAGRDFPKGLPLSMTLLFYLAISAF